MNGAEVGAQYNLNGLTQLKMHPRKEYLGSTKDATALQ